MNESTTPYTFLSLRTSDCLPTLLTFEDVFGRSLGVLNPARDTNKILKTKCYSARTGLKRKLTYRDYQQIFMMAERNYGGCKHCGWYSWVFYNHECAGVKIIENNDDFEKVKEQFVNHMNRSHPNICKKKMMMRLDNKQSLV